MKIFFDFDDTLFDTKAFADSIQSIFEEYGISKELFWSSYQDMRGKFLVGWCYSPEIQIKKLNKNHSFDNEQLQKKLEILISDTRRFLFPEVENVLSFLKKNNYALYILSFGDCDFQMRKVKGTGIDRLMEKIIITQSDKAGALEKEIKGKSGAMWFIDDKIKFIESVKINFPEIKTILMKRAGRYNQDEPNYSCDYVAENLDDVSKIIKSFN